MEERAKDAKELLEHVPSFLKKHEPIQTPFSLPYSAALEKEATPLNSPLKPDARRADFVARKMLTWIMGNEVPSQRVHAIHSRLQPTKEEETSIQLKRLYYPVYIAQYRCQGTQFEAVVDGVDGTVVPRVLFLNEWTWGAFGTLVAPLIAAPFWMITSEGLLATSWQAVSESNQLT
jgi:hypothetical protein